MIEKIHNTRLAMNVRLQPEEEQAVRIVAAVNKVSISDVIRHLMTTSSTLEAEKLEAIEKYKKGQTKKENDYLKYENKMITSLGDAGLIEGYDKATYDELLNNRLK